MSMTGDRKNTPAGLLSEQVLTLRSRTAAVRRTLLSRVVGGLQEHETVIFQMCALARTCERRLCVSWSTSVVMLCVCGVQCVVCGAVCAMELYLSKYSVHMPHRRNGSACCIAGAELY